MRICDTYRAAAERDPHGTAVRWLRAPHQGQAQTWRQLVEAADGYATELDRHGVPAGTRIGVLLADEPQLLPWLIAIWTRGCVVVPVDANWGAALRAHVVDHVGATWLLSFDASRASLTPQDVADRSRPGLPADT